MTGWPELDAGLATRLVEGYKLLRGPYDTHALEGGVSSRIIRVQGPDGDLVLKQPLDRFDVEADWRVDVRRVFVEHSFALAMAPHLPPGALTNVRAFAPQVGVLVMDHAPAGFTPWKERLLAGDADAAIARHAAELLAGIHDAGERKEFQGRFRNDDLFLQQRIEPYFLTVARKHPKLEEPLSFLEREFRRFDDLVHGDFSPKNLLTDGRRVMLIDHEVATRGDAAFDVAFLLSHLTLKGIHRPASAEKYAEASNAFLDVYVAERKPGDEFIKRIFGYVGALLAARAEGKSPAEYLNAEGRETAFKSGADLLLDPQTKPGGDNKSWRGRISMN